MGEYIHLSRVSGIGFLGFGDWFQEHVFASVCPTTLTGASLPGAPLSGTACRYSLSAMNDPSSLTPQEREVLALMAEGFSGDRIASVLQMSPAAIDEHRRSILEKLGLNDLEAVIRFVASHGLGPLNPEDER